MVYCSDSIWPLVPYYHLANLASCNTAVYLSHANGSVYNTARAWKLGVILMTYRQVELGACQIKHDRNGGEKWF